MDKHIKTPWTLDHLPPYNGTFRLVDANGDVIPVCLSFLREAAHYANSHDALVEALENLNSMARAFTVYRDDVGQVLQKQVETALKLAKGE